MNNMDYNRKFSEEYYKKISNPFGIIEVGKYVSNDKQEACTYFQTSHVECVVKLERQIKQVILKIKERINV